MVFYWMAMSACVYNPLIYCYFNVRFRTGFCYAFRWIPMVKNRNLENERNVLFPQRKAPDTEKTWVKSYASGSRSRQKYSRTVESIHMTEGET
uniref:G_PROTEIN_RECEP_F1_2 domain-containing protein n=1 Tax=Panagrellus redivivus TaxID=6233 RepID=A0A7E4VN53_PANRE